MQERIPLKEAGNNIENINDRDLVNVEIWGRQYKAIQKAASIIQQISGGNDNTTEHIFREFGLVDDIVTIVELFIEGIDIPEEQSKAMMDKWIANREKLLSETASNATDESKNENTAWFIVHSATGKYVEVLRLKNESDETPNMPAFGFQWHGAFSYKFGSDHPTVFFNENTARNYCRILGLISGEEVTVTSEAV